MTIKNAAWIGLALVGVGACGTEVPTSIDEQLLPDEPVTVEIRMAWDAFASGLEVQGGYGSPLDLGRGIVAQGFAGKLDARTLFTLDTFPTTASVRDTLGTTRPDSVLTYVGGRLVARFDTISSTNTGPVMLALGSLEQDWDPGTVNWAHAVDTIHDQRAWEEAGAGPVAPLATAQWDPAAGDSTWFELDSAQVAMWSDSAAAGPSLRVDLMTAGHRLEVQSLVLRLDVRPSVNPDTLIELSAQRRFLTFVYDPFPEPTPGGMRIGGAPAWRTILDIDVPLQLDGPAELCAAVGCPVALTPDRLNYAALVLHSSATEAAFQPSDTVGLDVRPVLSRAALPKSPLGPSLIGALGRRVGPASFAAAAGEEIEIPITAFARDILQGGTDETFDAPKTLALLSVFEPVSIAFASFVGPGGPDGPTLKLVVTAGKTVELP